MHTYQNIGNIFSRLMTLQAMVVGLMLLLLLAPASLSAAPAAPDPQPAGQSQINPGNNLPNINTDPNDPDSAVGTAFNIAFDVIGAFALLSITLSGFKYVTSAGDVQKASEARRGILFALVGLILAISAKALVTFLVHRASGGS